MAGKAYIGTSGWSYPHWRGLFYPEDLPQSKWLEHYIQHFDTVELNNPFYRLPKPETFATWRQKSPDGFVFSVKASRYITHIKRLLEPRKSLEKFFNSAEGLKEKCGPILFQLPPNMEADTPRLKEFSQALPANYRCTFEFRHHSWFCQEVYDIFKEKGIALCIASTPNYPMEVKILAPFVYARMHGSEALYASRYTATELKAWAKLFKKCLSEDIDVYVYFDNDYRAYAVENAKDLKNSLMD